MLWLLANLWAAADGFCDSLYYGMLGAESFKWNEHQALVTRRALVLAMAIGAGLDVFLVDGGNVVGLPVWLLWLTWEMAAVALSFSLFHNEAYNFGRLWIKVQDFAQALREFKFNYQSPTTTARWDFDGPVRWYMAGGAVLLLVIGMVLLARLH